MMSKQTKYVFVDCRSALISLCISCFITVDNEINEDADSRDTFQPDSQLDGSRKGGVQNKNSGSASIQFMITNRMRRILEEDLSYLPEEVDKMDPQIASVVIEKGLSRPSTGMPKKWIKYQQSEPSLTKYVAVLKSALTRFTKFTFTKLLPVVLPLAAIGHVLAKRFLGSPVEGRPISTFTKEYPSIFKPKLRQKSRPPGSSSVDNSREFSLSRKKREGLVDIRSLRQIIEKSNFVQKLFGR